MSQYAALREHAQLGLGNIKTAILDLLRDNRQGLGNSEIAELLSLHTGLDGRQKDYLTWSILQDLVAQGTLRRTARPNSKRQLIYRLA